MNTKSDEHAEADRRGDPATPQRQQPNRADIHPAAILLPDPTTEEYERLKEDIRQNGLRLPVVLTPDGRILDGRTRVRACAELGIPYITRDATMDEMLDPVAFVLSMNAARRHLTGDQVIALYLDADKAKIEADKQAAKATQRANLKQGAARPEGSTVSPSGKTAAKIAKTLGKSESAVKRVQRVKKVAPERFAELAKGNASAAEILKQELPAASEGTSTETARGGKVKHHHEVAVAKMVKRVAAAAQDDLSLDLEKLHMLAEDKKLTLEQIDRLKDSIDAAYHDLVQRWNSRAKEWGVGPAAAHEKVIDVPYEVLPRPEEGEPAEQQDELARTLEAAS